MKKEKLVDIIRFHRINNRRLIFRGVTLAQAKEWCSNPLTRGKDWFDGFAPTNTLCTKNTPKYTKYFIPKRKERV
jgi:hypothetical protein